MDSIEHICLINNLSTVSESMLFCSSKYNSFITATEIRIATWLSFLKFTVIFQYPSCFSGGERQWLNGIMMGNMNPAFYKYSIITVIQPGILIFNSISWPGWKSGFPCCSPLLEFQLHKPNNQSGNSATSQVFSLHLYIWVPWRWIRDGSVYPENPLWDVLQLCYAFFNRDIYCFYKIRIVRAT